MSNKFVIDQASDIPGYTVVKEDSHEGEVQSSRKLPNGKVLDYSRSFKRSDLILTPEENPSDSLRKNDIAEEEEEDEEEGFIPIVESLSNISLSKYNGKSSEDEKTSTINKSIISESDKEMSSANGNRIKTSLTPKESKEISSKEKWFIIYGDNYSPVVLTCEQFTQFQNELVGGSREKRDISVQTYNSHTGNSTVKVIYDQDNNFQNLYRKSTNLIDQFLIGQRTTPTTRPPSNEWQKFNGYEDICDKIDSLRDRNEIRKEQKRGRKVDFSDCLFLGDDEIDQQEEMIVIDRNVLSNGKKISNLQCKLRDFERELRRLNEDRFCLEMKCNQLERRNQDLEDQLSSAAKVERDLRCCLSRAEEKIEKYQSIVNCLHNKMAILVRDLQDDGKTSLPELLREEFGTLQNSLVKSVEKLVHSNDSHKNELEKKLSQVKNLEDKLDFSLKNYQNESRRVERLKEKLHQYQDDMQSSVTDFGSQLRDQKQELEKARSMIRDLNKKCSHQELTSNCKESVIADLQRQLKRLETEREQFSDRLRNKHSCYKARLNSVKDKYRERLKSLLDKQVQLCNSANSVCLDDKTEIALKKLEEICCEAIARMKGIQKSIKCNVQSDTELKERLNEINCKLETICKISPNATNKELPQCPGNNVPEDRKVSFATRRDSSCSPMFYLDGFRTVPQGYPSSCENKATTKPPLSVEQEVSRAQKWAAKVLHVQPSGCPFTNNQSLSAIPIPLCPLHHPLLKCNCRCDSGG